MRVDVTVTGKIATISNRTEQRYSAGRFFPSKEYESSVVTIAFQRVDVFLLQRERFAAMLFLIVSGKKVS